MEKTPSIHPEHLIDRDLLNQAIDLLEVSRIPRTKPVPLDDTLQIPEKLPEQGWGTEKTLKKLASDALESSAQLHHPGFMAHMDPPTPSIVWATALWQAATNQNLLHPDVAPKGRLISERVLEWLAPFFGMDGGHFVPGATVANLTALWAARELRGVKKVFASDKSHLSIRKAAHILGLEYISLDSNSEHQLRKDSIPDCSNAALVLNAGTVARGAIDPLERMGNADWVHVDAAWAGPLKMSKRYEFLLEGIELADSVGFSAHKWMYQPKGVALVFFKDSKSAHESLSYGGGYLSVPNIGLLGSAPASALPLAATLLAWGRKGMADHLEADMQKADQLASLIKKDSRFDLLGPNCSGIIVWRPKKISTEKVRERFKQAWVSLTEVDGEMWFRSVAANPGAEPDFLFNQVIQALS